MFGVHSCREDIQKIYVIINYVTLTFDLEIQGQTWRDTANIISLLVRSIIETCVRCLQLINCCQGIQKM